MKNTLTLLALVVVVGLLALYVIGLHEIGLRQTDSLGGGSSINVGYYKTATNTSVSCSGATSTALLAAATRPDTRMSLYVSPSSSAITVCRTSSGCETGKGQYVPANTTWTQEDAYYGAYTCIGFGVTSTVGLSYQQS